MGKFINEQFVDCFKIIFTSCMAYLHIKHIIDIKTYRIMTEK